jgi:hypothetical protein
VHQMHCNVCSLHNLNSTLIVDVLISSDIFIPRRCLPLNLMSTIYNSLPNGFTSRIECVSIVVKFHSGCLPNTILHFSECINYVSVKVG